jgi:hypothetical protein
MDTVPPVTWVAMQSLVPYSDPRRTEPITFSNLVSFDGADCNPVDAVGFDHVASHSTSRYVVDR